MYYERFAQIIEYSNKNRKRMEELMTQFYSALGMETNRDVLKLTDIARRYCKELNYFLVRIPFSDNEIGAMCFRRDAWGYVFVNTSVPKVNENFALAHELYHIFRGEESFVRKVELYIDSHYNEMEEEMKANLFAGMLLMPAEGFEEMFQKFKAEQAPEDDVLTVIVRLMNYFESPYMAVVIRGYELGLLDTSAEAVRELLTMEKGRIEEAFRNCWLDESILQASAIDEYPYFMNFLEKVAEDLIEKELFTRKQIERVIGKINRIYDEVRR